MSDYKIKSVTEVSDGFLVHLVQEPNTDLMAVWGAVGLALTFFTGIAIHELFDVNIDFFYMIPVLFVATFLVLVLPIIMVPLTIIMGFIFW